MAVPETLNEADVPEQMAVFAETDNPGNGFTVSVATVLGLLAQPVTAL